MSPLCLLRSFLGLLRPGPRVSGHAWVETHHHEFLGGELSVMKCSVCGKVQVLWYVAGEEES